MLGKIIKQQARLDLGKRLSGLTLRNNTPVVLFLLFFLALGTLAGIGFFFKSMVLEKRITKLAAENEQLADLQSLRMSNQWLKNRVAVLQEEKALILDNAVADLHKKSMIIETLLSSVGVDIQVQVSNANSGGPFLSSAVGERDGQVLRADRYLDTIQNVPLGAPVPGVITSRYGKRIDPLNGKPAYHHGVDIRGKMGSDVKATAGGTVIDQNYDKGHGRYVHIDHGNGFFTKYAHLKKSLVQKGDIVERGQVIGLVGNSGRSTGPHVHYEIHYDDKIINPTKYVRINKYFKRYTKNLAAKKNSRT
ncbi:MAG: M23 family metallopeptidase [Desulfobulbales bacterium]|nr:M23 family metallopeptidase [Desulfobulbales bacterium]